MFSKFARKGWSPLTRRFSGQLFDKQDTLMTKLGWSLLFGGTAFFGGLVATFAPGIFLDPLRVRWREETAVNALLAPKASRHSVLTPKLRVLDGNLSLVLVVSPGGTGKSNAVKHFVSTRRSDNQPALYVSVLEGKAMDTFYADLGVNSKVEAEAVFALAFAKTGKIPIVVIDDIDEGYAREDCKLSELISLTRHWSSNQLMRVVYVGASDDRIRHEHGVSTRLEVVSIDGPSDADVRACMTQFGLTDEKVKDKWMECFGNNISGLKNMVAEWKILDIDSTKARIESIETRRKLSHQTLSDLYHRVLQEHPDLAKEIKKQFLRLNRREGVLLAEEGTPAREAQRVIASNPLLGRIVDGCFKPPSKALEDFVQKKRGSWFFK